MASSRIAIVVRLGASGRPAALSGCRGGTAGSCPKAAEGAGNSILAAMIRIAAYSDSRREGIARLKVADIKTDPKTGVRFT